MASSPGHILYGCKGSTSTEYCAHRRPPRLGAPCISRAYPSPHKSSMTPRLCAAPCSQVTRALKSRLDCCASLVLHWLRACLGGEVIRASPRLGLGLLTAKVPTKVVAKLSIIGCVCPNDITPIVVRMVEHARLSVLAVLPWPLADISDCTIV